jgi:hypothetical protein
VLLEEQHPHYLYISADGDIDAPKAGAVPALGRVREDPHHLYISADVDIGAQ